MKSLETIQSKWKRPMLIGFVALFFLKCLPAASQILPPTITVNTVQNLSFGAFSQGSTGGTVVISNSGTRSATGTVVPHNLGIQYFQAMFDVGAPIGTIILIVNGPDAILTGSNGGTMTLVIGNSNPTSPFISAVAPPLKTRVNIGGTLTVGSPATTPAGSYTGTFNIIFNNQ